MNTLILTIHVIACVSLVILILLQSGHQGMGVIFGGSSSTFFGSSGAGGFLSKLTVAMAIIFFVTSLGFTYIDSKNKVQQPAESVVLEKKNKQEAPPVQSPKEETKNKSTSSSPNQTPEKQ